MIATRHPFEVADEQALICALRLGDEDAFVCLVDRYHARLLRFASTLLRDRCVAEEVVQDTWFGVVRGIGGFRGESSLRTWIFQILTNIANSRGVRESRSLPFAAVANGAGETAFEPDRFLADGHWSSQPTDWSTIPEERLLGREILRRVQDAIAGLPPVQAQVITLRYIEGWSSDDVCSLLDLSAVNQRVLLHRARSRVCDVLGGYVSEQA